jgi:hypothetical protein
MFLFLSMSSFLKLLDLLCSHGFHSVRVMFFELKLYTRRVPDTRLKPGGYEYRYEFLPAGMSIGMNFYPRPLCWWADNYSIRPEPDPLPTLYTRTTTPALAVRGLQSTKPLPRGVTPMDYNIMKTDKTSLDQFCRFTENRSVQFIVLKNLRNFEINILNKLECI